MIYEFAHPKFLSGWELEATFRKARAANLDFGIDYLFKYPIRFPLHSLRSMLLSELSAIQKMRVTCN